MVKQLFANDAGSTLQSSITTGATQLVIASGDAGLFPSPAAQQHFMVTVADTSGNMEIMKCTGRATNTLTVVRAQEGTTAFAFASGAVVDLRLTKGSLEQFTQVGDASTMPTHTHNPSEITGLDAGDVPFTPAGGLAATTVKAALEELDTEKAPATALGAYMPLAGGTFTGNVQITAAHSNIILNKAASTQASLIRGSTNGDARWQIKLGDETPEAGADAGSNFSIQAVTDGGTYVDRILIYRATGQAWFFGDMILHKPAGSSAILGINSNSASTSDSPILVLRKQGVDRMQLHADVSTPGIVIYSAIGPSAEHRFYTNDGTNTLQLKIEKNGNVTATGNLTGYSDERLKEQWADLPGNFIQRLAAVKMGTYTRIDTKERQVGVGAQSLRELMPEAVLDGLTSQEPLSVAYGNAALAAAVALAREVVELRARLDALEGAR